MPDKITMHMPRQQRRCRLPIGKLVDYIDRRTKELRGAIIHHVNADHNSLYLYLDSLTGDPVPLEFNIDWEAIFGDVPCAVTGKKTFVDDVVVSKEGKQRLEDRIKTLESFIIANNLVPPAEERL